MGRVAYGAIEISHVGSTGFYSKKKWAERCVSFLMKLKKEPPRIDYKMNPVVTFVSRLPRNSPKTLRLELAKL